MANEICGNRLERARCEAHPHVSQEYPCDLCVVERERVASQAEDVLAEGVALLRQALTEKDFTFAICVEAPPSAMWCLSNAAGNTECAAMLERLARQQRGE